MESGEIYSVGNLHLDSSSIWRDRGRDIFSRSSREEENDEEALKWAAIERLPTYLRLRTGMLTEEKCLPREVDVKHLGPAERKILFERQLKFAEEDNERFLLSVKKRIDRSVVEFDLLETVNVDDRERVSFVGCLYFD